MAITVPAAASEPASTELPSIAVARSAGTVVVTVRGALDATRSRHLGGILADLIDGQGNLSILVDLHDARAAEPDCLWMLTEAAERARRRGGTMRLDASPEVTSALQLRGLDTFVG
jgi:anti-anti-sigma regulatory factor